MKTLNVSTAWVPHYEIGHGVMMWTLFVPSHPGPVGFVWATVTSSEDDAVQVDVLGSYTAEDFRRQGVRSKIQDSIYSCWPDHSVVVTTGSGSESGEPWMIDHGYIYDEERRDWYVTREPKP